MVEMTGNQFLAEYLKALGVSHFFYVPVLTPIAMRVMSKIGVTPIVAHSEKAAAYMADGYARASGKVGFCGSQAIGGSNLAAGLRDALMARSPVVAITGGPTADTRHKLQYQDIDDTPVFSALAKSSAMVEKAERLPDVLRQAVRTATSGSPGPAHVQLAGFWGAVASATIEADPRIMEPFGSTPALRISADPVQVARAIEAIEKANAPMVVAGGGLVISQASEALMAFAEAFQIPIATSFSAKACVPESSALSVGVTGDYARESANIAVSEADLIIFVGSATGSMVTRNWTLSKPDAAIIHIDIDPTQIGRNYPGSIPLWGDARAVLTQLQSAMTRTPVQARHSWLERIEVLRRDWSVEAERIENVPSTILRPERLCSELSRALPEDALLVVDTGHSAGWVSRHVKFSSPSQGLIRAAGSLGWSFPAAIGAKCASPERPVICFTGDGGFLYHLTELETAVRYGVNVITIVNNNAALNQEKFLWADDATLEKNWRFVDTDYASVAEAFGAVGLRVTEASEIAPAIERALAAGRPVVIDVRTDIDAMVPPSWGPGAGSPYGGSA